MTGPAARLGAALEGRYRIERELGAGGMATVFLADDVRHDRQVAIKVLRPELAAAVGASRFLSEIKTTAKLQHPHILPLLDSGAVDGLLYYVMPFVQGESLRDRLNRERQLPLADAMRLTSEVSDALAHAHTLGIVHRDIKPENILLVAGHAVLADFGIALAIDHAAGDRLTGTGVTLGTPSYMSPEQASADQLIDGRSDIYSMGCVLYEMLAGQVPFPGPTAQATIARRMSQTPPSIRSARATVPPSLERAVMTALALSPADRFPTAAAFRAAIDSARSDLQTVSTGTPSAGLTGITARRVALALGTLLLVAAGFWLVKASRRETHTLDANLIAIAPFEVLDPELALWKQGFVDVLAANLDGAGAFRTVSPSVAIRRWSGRSDRASATAVAQRTGAGIAVFGRLESVGRDSLRCTVWIDNAGSGERLGEVELRESSDRMDRLGDSLSIAILRELGYSSAGVTARVRSLGSRSLPAIKLYLQGEQLFRRASLDSARRAYEHAVAIDSTFGPAMNRLAAVLGWQSTAYDAAATRLMLAAAQFVSGLSPRDSIQLTADALWARLLMFEPDSAWWTKGQQLLRTLRDMSTRAPDDFAAWNLLGETHFHLGAALGMSSATDALAAFERAIAIDSSFAPAWVHPIAINLGLRGPDSARLYIQGLLKARAVEGSQDWVHIVDDLLAGTLSSTADLDRRVKALSLEGIFQVWAAVSKWPDSAEHSIRIAGALAAARPSGNSGFDDPAIRNGFLVQSRLDRGHFREALLSRASDVEPELPYLAALGVIRADSANVIFDGWVSAHSRVAHTALEWWAGRADTLAIRRFVSAARARDRSTKADDHHYATFELRIAEAYLALARRDSTRAIDVLMAVPDSLCPTCYAHRLTLVQLLLAANRPAPADSILRRDLTALQFRGPVADFHWRVARARAAELTGATARAIRWYDDAGRGFAHGDPEARRLSAQAESRAAALRQRR